MKKVRTRLAHTGRGRFCPVCRSHASRFMACGHPPRPDAQCARCDSRERQRTFWLIMQRKLDLLTQPAGKRFLHIAPEAFLEQRLRRTFGERYQTADLLKSNVDLNMDLTDIQHPAGTWDVIACVDVLEHIPADRKAMSEMFRVLSPGGVAIISTPNNMATTVEDPNETCPAERLRRFQQEDHVRIYGLDIEQRLRDAGFATEKVMSEDIASADEVRKMRLSTRPFFICRK